MIDALVEVQTVINFAVCNFSLSHIRHASTRAPESCVLSRAIVRLVAKLLSIAFFMLGLLSECDVVCSLIIILRKLYGQNILQACKMAVIALIV